MFNVLERDDDLRHPINKRGVERDVLFRYVYAAVVGVVLVHDTPEVVNQGIRARDVWEDGVERLIASLGSVAVLRVPVQLRRMYTVAQRAQIIHALDKTLATQEGGNQRVEEAWTPGLRISIDVLGAGTPRNRFVRQLRTSRIRVHVLALERRDIVLHFHNCLICCVVLFCCSKKNRRGPYKLQPPRHKGGSSKRIVRRLLIAIGISDA